MCFAKIGLMVELEGKSGVVICHPTSMCAKFGIDRGNGSGDKSRAKSVT